MAATVPNFDLILTGILRRARGMPDPLEWLNAQHGAALDAVMAQDEYVTGMSDEGGNCTSMREIPANVLLQLFEAAIQQYEAELGNGSATSGKVRHGDFSQQPCILG